MAVMELNANSPAMAVRNRGRRFQLRVAAMTGMAASTEPKAYSVTNWPARVSEISRPALICGSRPAGIVSVMMARKPAIVKASSRHTGKRPADAGFPCKFMRDGSIAAQAR